MPRPIRVLHIVGAMNQGGVESWLMALLRHADRREIAMDFLVHTTEPAAYDSEIAALGGAVIPCPSVHRPAYIREFDAALSGSEPYDVLHSHVHWFSGLTTTLARRRGVRLRIAHSHSNSSLERKWRRTAPRRVPDLDAPRYVFLSHASSGREPPRRLCALRSQLAANLRALV